MCVLSAVTKFPDSTLVSTEVNTRISFDSDERGVFVGISIKLAGEKASLARLSELLGRPSCRSFHLQRHHMDAQVYRTTIVKKK